MPTPVTFADPAINGFAITPSDGTDLAIRARGIYVGSSGHVTLTMWGMATGASLQFKNVPAGTFIPVTASRVWNTGTSASDILGLY